MRRLVTGTIRLYQGWSARRVPVCRFHPSCSEYTLEAVEVHGPLRGLWLGARRVTRCRPGGGLGFDPVPPARTPSPDVSTVTGPDRAAARS